MQFLPEIKIEVIVDEKVKDIAYNVRSMWMCCEKPLDPIQID
jgi:hypothetical protein